MPHSRWGNGHYSKKYLDVLSSPAWQHVREQALNRAGWRCEECGRRTRLDGHHARGYGMLGHETAADVRMLCRSCHDRTHGRKSRHTPTSNKFSIWAFILVFLFLVYLWIPAIFLVLRS